MKHLATYQISGLDITDETKETCLNHLKNWEEWHKGVDRDEFQILHEYMHRCKKENKFGEQIGHIQKVKVYVKMCISDCLGKNRDAEKWSHSM